MKNKFDIVYIEDHYLNFNTQNKGDRPCVIVKIYNDCTEVLPLTSKGNFDRVFLSNGSYFSKKAKTIKIENSIIKYCDSETNVLSKEDKENIKKYISY